MIRENYSPDVAQYLEPDTTPFKFINPDNFKMQLKSGETEEEKSQASPAATLDKETLKKLDPTKSMGSGDFADDDDEEQDQIRQHEKTVNIRFGNYSMMMRAS